MEVTADQASEREDDSGIESSAPDPTDSTVYIRVAIPDLKLQVRNAVDGVGGPPCLLEYQGDEGL